MADLFGDALVKWKLQEPATGVLPSDAEGVLADLDADGVTNSRPPVIESAPSGFARVFDGATPTGLEIVDTGGDVRLTRTMTAQFILRLDLAAQDAAGVGTVCSYGFRDSTAEDLQFLVELSVVTLATRLCNIRMRWEDTSGVLEASNVGADFFWPALGVGDATIMLTVVREWRSDTEVIVRYYGNDIFLGKDNSATGLIGGDAGATMLLGNRGDGAAAYENYLEGELHSLGLWDRLMTAEEVRQIYRRGDVHSREQYENLKALVPEGVYSLDPSSIVQRELSTEAQMFAEVVSKIFEIREDFLPDRAWSFLDRWETVLGLIAKPSDTLATRRNTLLSFLRTVQGYSKEKIKDALTATFDLTAAQIQILEFDHFLTDDFATAMADFWQSITHGHTIGDVGDLTIATLAAREHRWLLNDGTVGTPHVKAVVDSYPLDAAPYDDAEVSVEVDGESFPTATESLGGIAFIDQPANAVIIVGLYDDGAGIDIGSVLISSGSQAAIVNHGSAPARPFYLNVKHTGSGSYDISTAPAGDRTDLTAVATVASGPTVLSMVALGMFGLVAGGSTGIDSIDFDDFQLYTPNGPRPFFWYAYRDPALSGTPDLPAADAIVKRIKPAHTQGAATNVLALLADDPNSLSDTGPLG